MRGKRGKDAAARFKARERERAERGWVNVKKAAKEAERPVSTVQAWINSGAIAHVVEDNRRYVQVSHVLRLARERPAFVRGGAAR